LHSYTVEKLKHLIYNTIAEAYRKLTPADVEKKLARADWIDRKAVRLGIRELVSSGKLSYTYLYGRSFIEESFRRPVRISERIVVKPPGRRYQPQSGEVTISIASGIAFGNGSHPSTYLALRALDHVLGGDYYAEEYDASYGLDVGTGTGILAIAMAMLGVERVVGLDLDPCALWEATQNVRLNNLGSRVTISDVALNSLQTPFSLIVANMAFPTLKAISGICAEKAKRGAILILSGFKVSALEETLRAYLRNGCRLIRQQIDRNWACLVLRKKGEASLPS